MPNAPKPFRQPGSKPRPAWARSDGADLRKGFRGRKCQVAKIRVGERDDWTCKACRKGPLTEKESILDHVTPLAQGGGHEDANLQLLCLACSRAKTARESRQGRQRGGG